jgi:hypothetical protein
MEFLLGVVLNRPRVGRCADYPPPVAAVVECMKCNQLV